MRLSGTKTTEARKDYSDEGELMKRRIVKHRIDLANRN